MNPRSPDGVARADRQRAILLMAHGSKDPAGQDELRQLERAVQGAAGNRPVRLGVLEYPGDGLLSIGAAGDSLAASGADSIVAVPVLLLQAGHGKLDMPAQFALARARHPHGRWTLALPLLAHPLLRAAIQQRLEEAARPGGSPPGAPEHGHQHRPLPGAPPAAGNSTLPAILLVGRGSSDASANADFFRIARLFSEEYGHPLVEACFVSLAAPDLSAGIERCVALGARSVRIVPYFLHTGILVQRIHRQAAEAQRRHPGVAITVAGHLANHPNVIRLLLLRVREAQFGRRAVACLAGTEATLPFLPVAGAPGDAHHLVGHDAHGPAAAGDLPATAALYRQGAALRSH